MFAQSIVTGTRLDKGKHDARWRTIQYLRRDC